MNPDNWLKNNKVIQSKKMSKKCMKHEKNYNIDIIEQPRQEAYFN